MYDKERIKAAFQQAADTYEHYDSMQKYAVDILYSIVKEDDAKYSKILEIGAGSGSLTRFLRSKYSDSQYFTNDLVDTFAPIYEKMGCTPLMGDAMEIDFPQKCDVVFSANCFQWIEEMDIFLKKLYNCLINRGKLIFSTYGDEHFSQLKVVNGVGLKYFSCEQMIVLLESSGFKVNVHKQERDVLQFASAVEMFRYFSLTGVHAVEQSKIWTPRHLASFEKRYKDTFAHDGGLLPLSVHYMWFSAEKIG